MPRRPLMAALRAPVTARGPWLTAVLNAGAAHRFSGRPVAVVVEAHRQGRPDAAAFLHLRRRGPVDRRHAAGRRHGAGAGGSPPFRLLARDDEMAGLLAAGIADLLRLAAPAPASSGWPASRSVTRRRGSSRPGCRTASSATVRTQRLVDDLDDVGPVTRSRDPRVLERWLPGADRPRARPPGAGLPAGRRPAARRDRSAGAGRRRRPGRAAHAGGRRRAAGRGGASGTAGRCAPSSGSPAVGLTAPARDWPPVPRLRSRSAARSPVVTVSVRPQLEHAVGGLPAVRGPRPPG